MILTLNDKNVPVTNFFETLNGKATMNASNSFTVTDDSVIPDVAELAGVDLTSYAVTNDNGVRIPTQGLYQKVESITAVYDDREQIYTLNIILV